MMAGRPASAVMNREGPAHRLLDGTRPAFLGRQCGWEAEDLTCEWYNPAHTVVEDMPAPESLTGEDVGWEGVELDLGGCPCREQGIRQWYWSLCKTTKFNDVLDRTGLTEAVSESISSDIKVQVPFIRALLNRFLPETGTFAMQWGEAGFTVEDAMALGKLPLGANCNGAMRAMWAEDAQDMVKTMTLLQNLSESKELKWNFSVRFYQLLGTGRYQAKHPEQKLRPASEEFEITLFLANWLSLFLFPGQPRKRMRLELIPLAYRLCHEKVDLASPITAAILRCCTDFALSCRSHTKVKMVPCAPLWLLQLWAFERYIYLRPSSLPWKGDYSAIKYWQHVAVVTKATLKQGLDDIDGFHFRPYAGHKLANHAPAFNGLLSVYNETVEEVMTDLANEFLHIITPGYLETLNVPTDPLQYILYRPDRVQRQFGFWQAVPRLFHMRFKPELQQPKGWIGCKIAIPPCGHDCSGCDHRYDDLWRGISQARIAVASNKNKLLLCPRSPFSSTHKEKTIIAIAAALDESPKQPYESNQKRQVELLDEGQSTSKIQPNKRSREENIAAPNGLVEKKDGAPVNKDDHQTVLDQGAKRRMRFVDELAREGSYTSTSDYQRAEIVKLEEESNEYSFQGFEEPQCEGGASLASDQVSVNDPIMLPSSSEAEQAEQYNSPVFIFATSTHEEASDNPPALQKMAKTHVQTILVDSPSSNDSEVAEVGETQVEQQSAQCLQHCSAKRLVKFEISTYLENMSDEALAGLLDIWVERGYLEESTLINRSLGNDWFSTHYPSLHTVYPQSPDFSSDNTFRAAYSPNPWWLVYVETMSRIGSLQIITPSMGVEELRSLVDNLKLLQQKRFDVRVPQGKLRHLIRGMMRDLQMPNEIQVAPDKNAMQKHLLAVKDLEETLQQNEKQHNEYKVKEAALRDELDRLQTSLGIIEEQRGRLSAALAEKQLAADNIAKALEKSARANNFWKELAVYEEMLEELSVSGARFL